MKEIFKRVKYAWHVLKGKPLVYRCEFRGGIEFIKESSNIWVVESHFYYDESE